MHLVVGAIEVQYKLVSRLVGSKKVQRMAVENCPKKWHFK
jgi:hypothetical protein